MKSSIGPKYVFPTRTWLAQREALAETEVQLEGLVADRPPEPGHVGLERLRRGAGRILAPEQVDQRRPEGDGGGGAGFDADPGPIDPTLVAALGDDVDPQAVPAVQREFLEMCVQGVDDAPEELAPLERTGLLAVCGCSYDAIVEDLRSEAQGDSAEDRERAAYGEFRDIESGLRAGDDLDPEIEGLIAACIRDEAGL